MSGFSGNGTDCTYCSSLVNCSNTVGSYVCSACPIGYSGNGTVCYGTDIFPLVFLCLTDLFYSWYIKYNIILIAHNPYLKFMNVLEISVLHHSLEVLFSLVTCLVLWFVVLLYFVYLLFLDTDECLNSSSCHSNATCKNSEGSYTCICMSGYSGNITHCTDKNECNDNPCSSLVNCTNTVPKIL